MSADLLRRAAALMRENAAGATPGAWEHTYGGIYTAAKKERIGIAYEKHVVDEDDLNHGEDDAAHIASWHPGVALAVAEMVSFVAEVWQDDTECHWPVGPDEPCGRCADCDRRWIQQRAVAVARAYLGESA